MNQKKKELLLSVFLETLGELDDVVIVRDDFGNIIYSNKGVNNVDFIKLSLLSQTKNDILLDGKNYHCIRKNISVLDKNFELEVYKDNTSYVELKQKSETDHLTNLINKRGIEMEMNKAESEFSNDSIPFAIIMGDIDNFKKINDTVGHVNGDKVLKIISSIIKNNIRNTDIAGRYGGEEFLIILKSCDINRAYDIVEKIRKNINSFPFELNNIDTITMSFGISNYNGNKSIEEVLEEADQALYSSKEKGRNKTTKYSDKIYRKAMKF